MTIPVANIATGEPLLDVTVQACAIRDGACVVDQALGVELVDRPFADFPGVADLPGYRITLQGSFSGYLAFHKEEYLSSVYFPGRPLNADLVLPYPQPLMPNYQLQQMASDLGVSPPNRLVDTAIFAATVLDCDDQQAPGVRLELQGDPERFSESVAWGMRGGLPERGRSTDRAGIAGFSLLPESNVTVCAEFAGRRFGATTVRLTSNRLSSTTLRADVPCQPEDN